jgi:TRAP-type mannitol/chloroaromatic compound transport system permease small subunit
MVTETQVEDWGVARKIAGTIFELSEITGQIIKYLVMALVLVLFIEVTSRYLFNSPTVWALETSKMLLGTIGACGWAYTHKVGGHVRVDVLYTMLPRRGQALIDVVMTVLMLFPLVGVLIYVGTKWAARAWETGEKMIESSWLPPAAPFRTALVLGFILFALQCIAQFLCDLYYLIKERDLL